MSPLAHPLGMPLTDDDIDRWDDDSDENHYGDSRTYSDYIDDADDDDDDANADDDDDDD